MGWFMRSIFAAVALVGVSVSLTVDTDISRPYFAAVACVSSLVFMVVYLFRPWLSTFAGRASMLLTSAVFLFSLNASLILWWPGGEGFPGYRDTTELVYVYLSLAVLYKLLALMSARRPDPTV